MPEYKAPLRDISFVMQDVFDCDRHYKELGYEDASLDMVDAIVGEAAKYCEQVIAPLNQSGDQEGCEWNEGNVTTPKGFKEAYKLYVEGGWPTLSQSETFGGQGLPHSLNTAISEMMSSANHSFSMYAGLSHGAMATIESHATDEQKQQFMPKLVDGSWTGTMCLTEPHCGTDLGMLRTKAELNDDGSYRLNGTKIFISAGEHDLSDNIVHIVIARIPGSPAGNKGISLFVVPKFNVGPNGEVQDRNGVHCGSIEHKMGINGNATCVINFDNAKGYLVGEVNKGLSCMFTFMNSARLGVALEGGAAAELAFQGSLSYAKERLQMRSLSGAKNPDGPADPIIVHPDVRRMLLTQKTIAEGGRAFVAYLAQLVDITHAEKDAEKRKLADNNLALLTPIAKAFLTEMAFECTSHGIQVLGGHGFIKEWGMEQILRDTKISCIYEGTTGIQALDLLGRKVMSSKGEILAPFFKEIAGFCEQNAKKDGMSDHVAALSSSLAQWQSLTQLVGKNAMTNPDEIGSASVDYLMFAGYVTVAYFWAKMASVAIDKSAAQVDGDKDGFFDAKVKAANFYFEKMLPRAQGHAACIKTGADSVMALDAEEFVF